MNSAKNGISRVGRKLLRPLWRLLPQQMRHRFWQAAGQPALDAYRRRMLISPTNMLPANLDAPLVVAGLFQTGNGLGEGARSTWRALKAAGFDPIAVGLSSSFGIADMESDIPLMPMPASQEGTLIIQLNSPELPAALTALDLKKGRKWYVIAFWAWELPQFPKGWEKNLDLVSEVWTPSSFTTAALKQYANMPAVETVGHVVVPPDGVRPDRAGFGIAENAHVYLVMADSFSSFDRKNPFGAISAFKQAFDVDPSRQLIVKTRNIDRYPAAKADLISAIGAAPNIRLIDETLSTARRWQLMASVDALISLPRSEGFGLTIGEMMALGKPVIVTGWSGNMDFCTPETAYIAKYDLVPCRDRYGVYRDREAVWAEPDTNHAAQLLVQADADISVGPVHFIADESVMNAGLLGNRMARILEKRVPV